MAAPALRPDIQRARDRMSHRLGSNREIKKLESYLWHGEQVHSMVNGLYGSGTGLLVLTDRRMLFVQDGWMSQTSESFGFDQVNSVQWTAGLALGAVIIYSAGNKAVISQVQKPDGRAMVDAVNNILVRPVAPAPPSAPATAPPPVRSPAAPAPIAPFDALRALRDHGVISAEEFGRLANRL
ncbi:PH domain-containing protein [Nocardiopsis sp. MG754419]|uniref:PH domain-containing protein n=1 Tax=Nocardiopsis sp. MG754419 TaxID=2259865 RepID=UPI001BA76712|nr:PH domain-containing protein [Nocardiopsis sp. MG754419]